MDLRVVGAREFFLLAADCRDAARGDLGRELRAGLRASVAPTRAAIRAAAGKLMPHSGGYAAVLVPALRVQPKEQGGYGIRLVVSAKGQRELRDARALDRGVLRHPVHGRRHRRLWTAGRPRRRIPGGQLVANPWATTRVPPGFATRTFDRQKDQIVDRLSEAMGTVANKISGG